MQETDRIPTNLRVLLILERLAEHGDPMTPAALGRALDLPKPTVHRLCATLLREGFLARCADGKRLTPGRRARGLGAGVLNASVHHVVRRQVMERVSRVVQETVNYAAPRETGMVYLERVETDWAFRIQLPIGSTVPFHCTASGKAYLASLSPAKRERLIRSLDMEPRTDKTHTRPETLLEELRMIAKQGYALDNEELIKGMVALAVPVLDADGRFTAALAFHGPTQRLTIDGCRRYLDVVRSAADDLGAE